MRRFLPSLLLGITVFAGSATAQQEILPEFNPQDPSQKQVFTNYVNNHPYLHREHLTKRQIKALPKADRPDLGWEMDFMLTIDPTIGRPAPERLVNIYNNLSSYSGGSTKAPGAAATPWVERGPNNVAGRTRAIVWDPNDPTGNKVWAGGVTGGLWYNNDITNSNSTWIAVNDFWDNLAITAIAFDPNNSQIVYVGTGEGWGTGSSRGYGVFKSTDGGATWNHLAATSNYYYVNDLVVRNESGTSVLYVGTQERAYQGQWQGPSSAPYQGLWRSTNGGTTFSQVMPSAGSDAYAVADIEIGANNRLWVGSIKNSYGVGGGAVLYSDNGTSWTVATTISNASRIELACAPSDANIVYGLAEVSGQVGEVFKTTNGGTTWLLSSSSASLTEPNDADNGIPSTDFSRGQAWYDLIAQVDPNNANTLIVGGIDLFRSTNGGLSWTQISKWSNNNNLAALPCPLVHADQHAVVFKPGSSSTVLFGTDGGVYYSNNISQAGTSSTAISERNLGYNVTQFYSCAIHPTAGTNYFLAGAQDNGTQQFTTAGMNSTTDVYGGDGSYCFIDQDNPNVQIVSYVYNDYSVSTNGGASFFTSLLNDPNTGFFINKADYDDNQNALYTSRTTNSLYRVDNVDQGFLAVEDSIFPTGMNSMATHIRVSQHTTNSTTLFVGLQNGDILKVTNANTSNPTTTNISTGLPSGSVSCIEVGATENDLIATYFNYGSAMVNVWASSNGGTTWVNKEGNLPDMPVRWVLQNPNDADEVILGTEVGIWSTSNFSASSPNWAPSNSGLANVRIDMMQMRDSDDEVIAATYGRGLFSSNGFATPPSYNVTFRVDMQNETNVNTVSVAGSFQGWAPGATVMTDPDNDNIYEVTVQLQAGSYEYKFLNGTAWGTEENIAGLPCVVSGTTNRGVTISSDTVLTAVCFGSCTPCASPPANYNVTFRVDMQNETGVNSVNVAGSFQSWTPGTTLMTDPNNDNIYEVTVQMVAQTIEYKFLKDNAWGSDESVPGACNVNGNRGAVISGDTVLPVVCFGSCTACPASGPTVTPPTIVNYTACYGDTVIAQAAGASSGSTYNWYADSTSVTAFATGNPTAISTLTTDTFWVAIDSAGTESSRVPFVITVFPQLMVMHTVTNESVLGANDGAVDISVSGGTSPYSYMWSNGASSEDITNLSGGTYTVTVTDAQSCNYIESFTVASGATVYNVTFRVDMQNQTGVDTVSLAGNFQSWSPGTTLMDDSNNDDVYEITVQLQAGSYEYKYINGTAWGLDEAVPAACNVNGNRGVTISADTILPIVCFASCTACPVPVTPPTISNYTACYGDTVIAQATGISGTYNWYVDSTSATAFATGNPTSIVTLVTDTFWVAVDSAGSESARVPFVITVNPQIMVMHTISNESVLGANDGSVDISVSGGTTPYSYAWSNTAISEDISNLAGGTYTVTVTDSVNCTYVESFVVASGPAVYNVTFRVDMQNETGVDTVSLAGSFQSWSPGTTLMDDSNNDDIYEITVQLQAGSYEYKYINGTAWGLDESVPAACNVNGNRGVTISADTVLPVVCFGSCTACNITPTTFNVTFRVDMQNETGVDTVSLAGSFQNWAPGATLMDDSNNDDIYEITVQLQAGSYEYKYINGTAWGLDESVPAACNINGNRGITVSADTTLPIVCFASCTACPAFVTAPTISNYNACYGDTVLAQATGISGTYNWYVDSTSATAFATGNPTSIVTLVTDTFWVAVDSAGSESARVPFVITVNPQIVLSSTVSNETTAGANDGSIDLSISGGTGTSYTVSWSNAAQTEDISGLAAGTYAVTVTDSIGCTSTASYTVMAGMQVYNVTFRVDMQNETGVDTVSLAGSFQSWSPGTTLMDDSNNDDIYEITLQLQAGSYEYKFINGTAWGFDESVPSACAINNNRGITISADTVLPAVCFASCTPCATPPATFNVTFRVDMRNEIGVDTVSLAGNFQNWAPGATLMDDSNNDDIYEITVQLQAGSYEYKYINGTAWGLDESVPAACNVNGNRGVTISADTTLPIVCFASCTACPISLTATATADTCGLCNGTAMAQVNGNVGTVLYTWTNTNGDTVSTNMNVMNACAGTYYITIVDSATGTSLSDSAVVAPMQNITAALGNDTSICDGTPLVLSTPNYMGASYSWNTNDTTASITVSAAGNYSVTVTYGTCVETDVITVSSLTNFSISAQATNATCGLANGGANVLAFPLGGNFTYNWSTGSQTDSIAGISGGTYYVTVSDGTCSLIDSVTIQNSGLPMVTLQNDTLLCYGATNGALATQVSGGTAPYSYSWSNQATMANILGVSAGTYTVTVTDALGCSATQSAVVIEPAAIALSATITDATCGNTDGSIQVSAANTVGSTTFTWNTNAIGNTLSNVAAGCYTVVVTDSNACVDSATYCITNSNGPSISFTTQNANCETDMNGSITTSVTNGTAPYSFNWNTNANDSNLMNVAAGHYLVTVTDAANCIGIDSVSVGFNFSNPVFAMSNDTSICDGNAATFTATSGFASYNWSNGGMSNSIVATTNGNYLLTVTDANGCSALDSVELTVLALPQISFTAVQDFCSSNAPVTLSNATPLGGTYFGAAVVGNNFIPSSATSGANQVGYTVTAMNGCIDTSYFTINVNPIPTVTFNPLQAVCIDNGVVALSGASPVGGTFSGTGVTNGFFNPNAAGAGQHLITYNYTDGNGCSNTAAQFMVVNALPNVSLNLSNVYCANSPIDSLVYGLPMGGSYSGAAVTNNNFNPQVAGVGSTQITYNYTDGNGCSNTATTSVTVNATPNVSLNPISAVCINGSSVALTSGFPSGGSYFGLGVVNDTLVPQVAGVGSTQINYTYTDAIGCSDTASATVTVNDLPQISMNLVDAVCEDTGAVALTGVTPAGGVFTGNGVSNGVFNSAVAGAGASVITYTVTGSNGCTGSASDTIVVNPLPTVSFGSLNDLCYNSPTITLAGGLPSGGVYSGVGVANNQFTAANAGTGLHNLIYTFTNSFGCSDSATTTITVNALPNVSFAGTYEVCEGASAFPLAGGSPMGGTYSGTGIVGTNFDPAVAGVGSHVILYSYTDANGCSNSNTNTFAVNALPTLTLSNDTSVCRFDTLTLVAAGASTYLWSTGATTASASFVPSASGAYSVTATDTNSCVASGSVQVTVLALPSANLGGDIALCDGDSNTFTMPSGVAYLWNDGSTMNTYTTFGNETVWVQATNAVGCVNSDTVTVGLNPNPVIDLGPDTSVCKDQVLFVELDAGAGYAQYNWNNGFWFLQTLKVNQTGTYSVVVVDNNGCTGSDAVYVEFRTCVGIEESVAGALKIYPNPTSGLVQISQDKTVATACRVFDATGRLITQMQLNTLQEQIDLSPFATGTYYLHVLGTSNELLHVQPIIKH